MYPVAKRLAGTTGKIIPPPTNWAVTWANVEVAGNYSYAVADSTGARVIAISTYPSADDYTLQQNSENVLVKSSDYGVSFTGSSLPRGCVQIVSNGASRLVAAVVNSSGTGTTIYYSDGADSWTLAMGLNTASVATFRKGIYVNGTYFIIGNNGIIFKSTNGISWSSVYIGINGPIIDIFHTGTKYILFVQEPNGSTRILASENADFNPRQIINGDTVAIATNGTLTVALYATSNSWHCIRKTTGAANLVATAPLTNLTDVAAPTNIVYHAPSGLFVMSGNSGMYTSSDCVTWTVRQEATGFVVYLAGSVLFAVKDLTTIYTSTDAITWTSRILPTSGLIGNVATDGSGTYILGQWGGRILVNSTPGDLTTWSVASTPATNYSTIKVAYYSGNWYMIYSSWVKYSSNLTTWTIAYTTPQPVSQIAVDSNGVVVVCDGRPFGEYSYSNSGTTGWADVTHNATTIFPYLESDYGSEKTITVLTGSKMLIGTYMGGLVEINTTTRALSVPYPQFGHALSGNQQGYYTSLCGYLNSKLIYSVKQGICYSSNLDDNLSVNVSGDPSYWNPNGIVFGAGIYVMAIHNNNVTTKLYSSTDLITWTLRYTVGEQTALSYFINGTFVANSATSLYSSTDGINWTTHNLAAYHKGSILNNVLYINSKWLTIGGNSLSMQKTTLTAGAWTVNQNSLTPLACVYNAQTELIVAVGQGGLIKTRTRSAGIGGEYTNSYSAWTIRSSNTTQHLFAITYSATLGLYIAVGCSGVIVTSPDATTWTVQTSGTAGDLYCVAENGAGIVVAGGAGGIMRRSTNATAWAAATSYPSSDNVHALVWSSAYSAFFAGGGNSDTSNTGLMKSADGNTWSLNTYALPTTGRITSIALSPSGTAATALTSSSVNSIMYSTMNSNWTYNAGSSTYFTDASVVYYGATFAVLGNNKNTSFMGSYKVDSKNVSYNQNTSIGKVPLGGYGQRQFNMFVINKQLVAFISGQYFKRPTLTGNYTDMYFYNNSLIESLPNV